MRKRYKQNYNPVTINPSEFENPKRFSWKLPKVLAADGKHNDIKKVVGASSNDAIEAMYSSLNTQLNALPSRASFLIDTAFIGYGALSALISSNGILNAICKTLSSQMCRTWIEFKGVDGDKDNTQRIMELEEEFKRLNVRSVYEKALYQTFAFGGSYIFPAIGDIDWDNKEDPDFRAELQTELVISKTTIGKGDLKYLKTIEPMWVVPTQYDTTNPFSTNYYNPETYSVIGVTTHRSRLLKFIYNEAPDIYKPAYLFNGVPLIQYCIPYVSDFEAIRTTITAIVKRYNLNVLKTSVERILTSNNVDDINSLKARIAAFNSMRDNLGILALDNDTEDFVQLSMNLSQLAELETKAAEFMCIVPKLPATKLLGVTPSGFQSTGEHELTSFYDLCNSLNNEIGRPHLEKIMHMTMLNLWGEIDEGIIFEFNPLEEMNDKELAEINKLKADTDLVLMQANAIDGEDIQERLRSDEQSGYDGLEERERDNINNLTNEFNNFVNNG